MKREVAKVFLNVAYLFVGGVLLTGIMRNDVSTMTLVILGGVIPTVLVIAGLLFIYFDKKNPKK